MQWNALFRKEVLENWRNKKWIWVPLVMILIAVMDPITTYYTPMIIDSVGGLPEGSVLELPELTPPEVIMMSLSQYSLLGVMVIALISMGTIAGERKSGVLELVLVKPVSFANYITAKWTVLILLVWISLFLGILASWYYINILFGDLAFTAMLQVVGFYGLWLTLVVSLAIFYNALVNNQGLVLFFTIMTIMVMSIVTQIFGHVLTWSPNKLAPHIQEMLLTGQTTSDLWGSAAVTIILSAALVAASIFVFRKKEMAA